MPAGEYNPNAFPFNPSTGTIETGWTGSNGHIITTSGSSDPTAPQEMYDNQSPFLPDVQPWRDIPPPWTVNLPRYIPDPHEELLKQERRNRAVDEAVHMAEVTELLTKLKKAEDTLRAIEAEREAQRVHINETKPKERRIDLDL